MINYDIPIITIDGTASSGKGTIRCKLAQKFGWHELDTGMLYRAVGLSYIWHLNSAGEFEPDFRFKSENHDLLSSCKFWDENFSLEGNFALGAAEANLADIASKLQFKYDQQQIYLQDLHGLWCNVTLELRREFYGHLASKLAVLPQVREALLRLQRSFVKSPGLVADGRDLGTVVFPEAKVKFFLDANPKVRAQRRELQLKEFGVDGNLYDHVNKLEERDLRDQKRNLAPLRPAQDAIFIDTTYMNIAEVFNVMLNQVNLIILR